MTLMHDTYAHTCTVEVIVRWAVLRGYALPAAPWFVLGMLCVLCRR